MNDKLLRQLIRESIYKKILLEININRNERQFLRAKDKKDIDKIKSIYAKLVGVDTSTLSDNRSQKLEKLKDDIKKFLDKNSGQENQKAAKKDQAANQSTETQPAPQKQDQKPKTAPKKSNSKVAKLQKIIGEKPADGVWKESTNKAWKTWITSERTFKAIQKTAPKIKDALTKDFLNNNKGKAATIASAAGKAGNISGVLELAELINYYVSVNKDQSDRSYEKEADNYSPNEEDGSNYTFLYDSEVKPLAKKSSGSAMLSSGESIFKIPVNKTNFVNYETTWKTTHNSKKFKDLNDYLSKEDNYHDKKGRQINSNFSLDCAKQGTTKIGNRNVHTFYIIVDGTLAYNSVIKNFVAVYDKNTQKSFFIPLSKAKKYTQADQVTDRFGTSDNT